MNKPAPQLELIPSTSDKPETNGMSAVLAATGLTPREAAAVEAIIAEAGPTDDGFDWQQPDECIVVQPRPGIAIYRNNFDDVVIRTQNVDCPDDGDHFAYVRPESLPAVIKALRECLS